MENKNIHLIQDFNDFKVYRFNKNDVQLFGYVINIETFKYLSVLTNGFINPNSNWYYPNLNPICYLEFSTSKKIKIDGEIKNLNIFDYLYSQEPCRPFAKNNISFMKLFYHVNVPIGVWQMSFDENIYIVLSNEPIDLYFHKNMPFTNITDILGAGVSREYWIGELSLFPRATSGLFYMPHCPKGIRLIGVSNPLITYQLINWTDINNQITIFNANGNFFTEQIIYSTRLSLIITNTDIINQSFDCHIELDPMNLNYNSAHHSSHT
jgi:hypothetical protein